MNIINNPTFVTTEDVHKAVLQPDSDEQTDQNNVDDNVLGALEDNDVPTEFIL